MDKEIEFREHLKRESAEFTKNMFIAYDNIEPIYKETLSGLPLPELKPIPLVYENSDKALLCRDIEKLLNDLIRCDEKGYKVSIYEVKSYLMELMSNG
jgi:hypothetical protein